MILVVGWDGADLDLVGPWMEAGELPCLAALARRASVRRLRSTVPPVTFPAWTSFATACDPSWHGVTDFTVRDPSDGRLRFVNASWRERPTIFSRMEEAGLRVGVIAFPATWPPEPLTAQVCGFDTPLGSVGSRATEPAELGVELVSRYGRLPTGGPDQTRIGPGWHDEALASILSSIELRTRVAIDLAAAKHLDVLAVHFMESDTAAHHFWQYHDPDSPRFRSDGPAGGLLEVYRALDRALGVLLAAVGEEATVMLVSDHGSIGASDRVVFWNRWLADRGYLAWKRGAALRGRLGAFLRRVGIQALPRPLQRFLWRRMPTMVDGLESEHRFGGVDWSRTRVFSEELNYAPAFWINLAGREPEGVVAGKDVDRLVADLEADLAGFVDPVSKEPVVARVCRREEIYSGPHAGRLPDLLLELATPGGYAIASGPSRGGAERRALRSMTVREASGAKGTFMSGAHRPSGLCVLAAPGQTREAAPEAPIEEAGATLAALAGLAWPGPPCARPWGAEGALPAALGEPPAAAVATAYDEEGERELYERLRALGYLR